MTLGNRAEFVEGCLGALIVFSLKELIFRPVIALLELMIGTEFTG